jgi:hypothetical protein
VMKRKRGFQGQRLKKSRAFVAPCGPSKSLRHVAGCATC